MCLLWHAINFGGDFFRSCFFAAWQVAYMSALLCHQTMELQEEKVNTTADWLADEATSWLLGSDWARPRKGLAGFGKGWRGSFKSPHTKGSIKHLSMCVSVCCVCWGGGTGALPIKRMGQRKQSQETGSWKRKLHPLSLHNTVPMATASRVGSQQRKSGVEFVELKSL